MLTVEASAWQTMVRHAEATYPRECCGVMLGTVESGAKRVTLARALDNAYEGGQEDRYEIRPVDLLRVEREAREQQALGDWHLSTRILTATLTSPRLTWSIAAPGIAL